VLEGDLPRRTLDLVLDWAELHQDELRENWRLARAKSAPKTITSLREWRRYVLGHRRGEGREGAQPLAPVWPRFLSKTMLLPGRARLTWHPRYAVPGVAKGGYRYPSGPFASRTRKLSPSAPMVLHAPSVGE